VRKNSLCPVSNCLAKYNSLIVKGIQYCIGILVSMDPHVYESYTVRTSYAVSNSVTRMDSTHLTFVAYLFSTIFSTSTSTPYVSTMAQTEFRIPKTNPAYVKRYFPTTTSPWIRPKWYNEQDYWRNIVSKELSFHGRTTTTAFNPTKKLVGFSDKFAGKFLPPRCCPKKTTTTAIFGGSTESNLVLKNEEFSMVQICILTVLCLIFAMLVCFSARIIYNAGVKRKFKIRSKEAYEMSSFSSRRRTQSKEPHDVIRDIDMTTDLLECTRDSRKGKDKFETISLKSKTGLPNENFCTKFTTKVDIH
jgi:hypothetical protein